MRRAGLPPVPRTSCSSPRQSTLQDCGRRVQPASLRRRTEFSTREYVMSLSVQAPRPAWWSNAALLVTITLPLLAVGSSLWAAVLAYGEGDPALPEAYHWEGSLLDDDLAAAARAA